MSLSVPLPICLVLSTLPWSWQNCHLKEAAQEYNEKAQVVQVAPECDPDAFQVPVSVVRRLPDWCLSENGCTRKSVVRVDGDRIVYFAEIVIHEDAPGTTIYHEINHLLGAEDKPYGQVFPEE